MKILTIGEMIEKLRIEQKITLEELSRGICSISTLKRVEKNEKEIDFLMATVIFERLGYTLDKFEYYGSYEEIKKYNLYNEIRHYMELRKIEELRNVFKEFRSALENKATLVDKQFLDFIKGFLLFNDGEDEKAKNVLEEAAKISIPYWTEKRKSKMLFGCIEIEILLLLSDIYEKRQEKEKSNNIRREILYYLEQRKENKNNIARIYISTICRVVSELMKEARYQEALYLVERGIKKLGNMNRMYYWLELLYKKSECLEKLFEQEKVTKKQVINAYQETYYIAKMYQKNTEATVIKKYLEERYKWESII